MGGKFMKRSVFGILLTIIGLIFAAFSFIYAAMNPWNYNGIGGLRGSFLGTNMTMPFVVGLIVMIIGLSVTFYEAYIRK